MELVGDEKRIQALLSEMRREDQRFAPPFENLWRRAEFAAREPKHTLTRSLVVITTVVVIAGSLSLAFLYRRSLQPNQAEVNKVSRNRTTDVSASIPEFVRIASANPPGEIHQVYKRPPRKKVPVTSNSTRGKVATLSSWQSPTAVLMDFPAGSFLKSVPELNQPVRELQSFLTDDHSKERNQ